MSLNETPSAERLHIGFFGRRNVGKSSLVNAVTGQSLSIVSPVKGTTTDPVKKAMELLPLGPVLIIDTPGLDDEGSLGEMRVQKTKEVLAQTDIALVVLEAGAPLNPLEQALILDLQQRKMPHLLVYNKADLISDRPPLEANALYASAETLEGVEEVKQRLGALGAQARKPHPLVADLLSPGDLVLLVMPIDESAPKGRLILPQQQVLRELLDHHITAICCQDTDVQMTLARLSTPPRLVITDSQAFAGVGKDVPKEIPLTSFSILFARYKGDLPSLIRGADRLSRLRDGDRVLISEGCTHHRQCKDIGTVKIPDWIRRFSGADPTFSFTSGGEFPQNLKDYALIVHCGGCMLTENEMKRRMSLADAEGIPMVNYGMAIAHMNGLLSRSLEPFGRAE